MSQHSLLSATLAFLDTSEMSAQPGVYTGAQRIQAQQV